MLSMHGLSNLAYTKIQLTSFALGAVGNGLKNRTDPVLKRKNALDLTARYSQSISKNLGIQVDVKMSRPNLFDRNYFMVCNHMSYLDILILSSIRPAVFVTSAEVEKTFFLGDIAKLGGSFFVDRVNRRKIKEEVQALVDLLNQGFNVFIFPEGTSTNGSEILPFKKSLFRVPFLTDFPILPISLRYESVDGEPFSTENRDRICWYDDMTFAPHFLQLMKMKSLVAKVEYLEPLNPSDFKDHGELAQKAHEMISSAYNNS